jgi:hypothetical protein
VDRAARDGLLKYIALESKERLNDSPEFGPKNEHSFMRATDHSPK